MKPDSADVFALHGFLGDRSDWDLVFQFLKEEKPHWRSHAVEIIPQHSMEEWAQDFNQWVKKNSQTSSKKILVGYSMGGRLALHALSQEPSLWAGAVFLSTHPGLTSNEDKLARLENDRKWAHRFAQEELQQVILDWNQQSVFAGSQEPQREWQSLDRQKAGHALTMWSLGAQKNFREFMDLWSVRQIWAAGEKDIKFSQLLKTIPEIPEIQKWVIEEASHRLVLEAPQEVAHFVARVGSPIIA